MSRPSESVNVMEDSEECIRLALKSISSTESLICGISKRRLGKHSSPNEIAVRNALQKEPGVTDVPCSLAQAEHSLQIIDCQLKCKADFSSLPRLQWREIYWQIELI